MISTYLVWLHGKARCTGHGVTISLPQPLVLLQPNKQLRVWHPMTSAECGWRFYVSPWHMASISFLLHNLFWRIVSCFCPFVCATNCVDVRNNYVYILLLDEPSSCLLCSRALLSLLPSPYLPVIQSVYLVYCVISLYYSHSEDIIYN